MPTQAQGVASQPFGYRGDPRDDETDLLYLWARMHDPAVGRFLNWDWYLSHGAASPALERTIRVAP